MIEKCKICKGSGKFVESVLFNVLGSHKGVCPVCRGAGEFAVSIPEENLTTCRYCEGKGLIEPAELSPFAQREICPACKGLGRIERLNFGGGNRDIISNHTAVVPPRLAKYEYDIAVSYAGEDRKDVNTYCEELKRRGLKIFYDRYEQEELWGKNLYDKLDEVYRLKAIYCVLFISVNYAEKLWTNHERKAAQARAFRENKEYILPVRIDDTEIPGIPETVFYLDLREISIEQLVESTLNKVAAVKESLK